MCASPAASRPGVSAGASALMNAEHRHFAEHVTLRQPIAAYEGCNKGSRFVVPWPPNITGLYERAFFGGRYALNRAWQEVPSSVMTALVDTIKTKVLRLALELKTELGTVGDNVEELPKERVDQQIVTVIYGGYNVIASRHFNQVNTVEIQAGDWNALAQALAGMGVRDDAVVELRTALANDKQEASTPTLGKRTLQWLSEIGKKTGTVALAVGIEVVKKQATELILKYLGIGQHA